MFQRAVGRLVGSPCAGVLRAANGIELFFGTGVRRGAWETLESLEVACRWSLIHDGVVLAHSTELPDLSPSGAWPRPPLFPGLLALQGRVLRSLEVRTPVHDFLADFGDGWVLHGACVAGSPWIDWAVVTHEGLWLVSGDTFGPA